MRTKTYTPSYRRKQTQHIDSEAALEHPPPPSHTHIHRGAQIETDGEEGRGKSPKESKR
jgi:hypothetical protein